MKITIKTDFKEDYISREAGERLRKIILESVNKEEPIEIDFQGIVVASTSFFDEAIAKLGEAGWDREKMKVWIQFKNLHPKDKELMLGLCDFRGW